MIEQLDISSAQGGILNLPMDDEFSPFVVEEIDGLDPVKAALVSTSFARQDGTRFNSARREARNITMQLGLDPDEAGPDTVASLRKRIYSVLMPKSLVDMNFIMSDGLEVEIQGRVETCEIPMFVREPVANISIVCDDPDFVDPDLITKSGNTTSGSSTVDFLYEGSVETGFMLRLAINRSISEFTIYHQAPDGLFRSMLVQAPFVAGDVVRISTVSGLKYATRTRIGTDTSVLFAVSPQASWMEFQPGINKLRVYASGAAIPYTFEYVNRYGGL